VAAVDARGQTDAIEENVYAGTAMSRRADHRVDDDHSGVALDDSGGRGPGAGHVDRRRGGDRVPDGTWDRGSRGDALLLPFTPSADLGPRARRRLPLQQRDQYAYLHDQTRRLLNQGRTGDEIAEMIELPPALTNSWSTHGYYGSVSHDVKAIYQRYMGWFDGSPAKLWPHPPAALATRYVDAFSGVDRVDVDHDGARSLYADTLEQLGYGAENGTWRNFFLSAAELREGNFGTPRVTAAPAVLFSPNDRPTTRQMRP
jgi:alkyl sulfatase BDS1-like metallo-beta-lactamase superfamily hydrolase